MKYADLISSAEFQFTNFDDIFSFTVPIPARDTFGNSSLKKKYNTTFSENVKPSNISADIGIRFSRWDIFKELAAQDKNSATKSGKYMFNT